MEHIGGEEDVSRETLEPPSPALRSSVFGPSLIYKGFNNNDNKVGGIVENRRPASSYYENIPISTVQGKLPPSTPIIAFIIFPEPRGAFRHVVSHLSVMFPPNAS
ncbi:hypothetical protein [Arabiibacter massiliensis]|uniref:hypothetical protein n=1 Tax=Arabiibacter massiliensis TaxID=1870985 RepID=UPI00117A7DC3|nr:hypothetical protein [Arabiibacter massiliensis]